MEDRARAGLRGNTVVLKPAETTPLTALLFAEVCQQADLPPGVVNIVTGAGDTGRALVEHPGVDKIAFTGSTEVGKTIARTIAGTRVRATLELGGKAANIVFDDAPIDQAVEGIVNGIFFNQGHVCCAGSRLLVQEYVHDEVIAKLKRRLTTLRVGDPLDKNTDLGAINSRAQLDRIRELSGSPRPRGLSGGALPASCRLAGSGSPQRCSPVSLRRTGSPPRRCSGPVLSVLTFRTPQEAVAKANNTAYGLSAGVWTDKGSRILWMADQLRAGVVWANTFNHFDPTSPFGGYKESGYGREGGRHGLEAYVTTTPATLTGATRRRRLDVRKTYKLYIGGAFPRSESGARTSSVDRRGVPRQRLEGLAQGRPRRGRRGARGVPRLGRRDCLQPRPGALPRRRGDRGPVRPVRRRGVGGEGLTAARPRPSSTPRSTAGSGTPAGPTRWPRSSAG